MPQQRPAFTPSFIRNHEKRFFAEVLVGDRVTGVGYGRSKKHAERAAAEEALVALDATADPKRSGA